MELGKKKAVKLDPSKFGKTTASETQNLWPTIGERGDEVVDEPVGEGRR